MAAVTWAFPACHRYRDTHTNTYTWTLYQPTLTGQLSLKYGEKMVNIFTANFIMIMYCVHSYNVLIISLHDQHTHTHTHTASNISIVLRGYFHWLPWEHSEWAVTRETGSPGNSTFSVQHPPLSCSHAWLFLSVFHLPLLSTNENIPKNVLLSFRCLLIIKNTHSNNSFY